VGDCYTQSVMMSDLSIAVAPRLGFLTPPLYSLLIVELEADLFRAAWRE